MQNNHAPTNLWHKANGDLRAWYFKLMLVKGLLLIVLASFALSLSIMTPYVQAASLHVNSATLQATPHIVCNPDC